MTIANFAVYCLLGLIMIGFLSIPLEFILDRRGYKKRSMVIENKNRDRK